MLDPATYSTLSALDITREVNAGQVAAVEIAAAALELAEQRGPRYGAFTHLAADRAMADARRTDERIAAQLPASDLLTPGGAEIDLLEAERGAVRRALARTGGNVSAAARALGVSRATLHRKLHRLGLIDLH